MTTVSLGTRVCGNSMDHLRAVFGDAACFVFLADHEAGDVLQEHKRDAALVTEFDEVSPFERGLAEQHAVVGDDADGVSVDAGEAADEGRAVARFELAELASVHEAGDDLAHIVGLAEGARAGCRTIRQAGYKGSSGGATSSVERCE